MPKTLNYADKNYQGTVHWFEAKDWSLYYVGNKMVDDLLSTPTPELENYGWYKLVHEMTVEIPVIRKQLRRDGKAGYDYNNYWLVVLDFDFFLERQLRDLVSLKVDEDELPALQSQITGWIAERLDKRKKERFYKDAAALAEQLGMSVEDLLSRFDAPIVSHSATTTILRNDERIQLEEEDSSPSDRLTGLFVMLGNESFIEVQVGSAIVERYKLDSKDTLARLLDTEEANNPRELVGRIYTFLPDTETPCKSSRKPKGWVKEIVW